MKLQLTLLVGSMTAVSLLGCHCARVAVEAKGPQPAPPACDLLSPVASTLTNSETTLARQEVVVSATLLSRVPRRDSVDGDELFMVMIKQNPYAPEEAVYILQTATHPPGYKVIHARAKSSLVFKDVNDPSVGADFTEAAIDVEATQGLERSWGSMTLKARWPERKDAIARMKYGGTVYTFDYRGDNVYGQGNTISPEGGTCTANLVELGALLSRFADEPDIQKRAVLRAQLVEESRALSKRLN
jgi:hypothetical protein